MASNKAKILEESLMEDMHPFAARKLNEQSQEQKDSPTQVQEDKSTTNQKSASLKPVNTSNSGGTPKPDYSTPKKNKPEEITNNPPLANNHVSMKDCIHSCMHEIMQESDDLKEPGDRNLSVRVTPEDFKWLRMITNEYNDVLNKKFNQGLFIRIGLKFLKKVLKDDPKTLKELLEEIK